MYAKQAVKAPKGRTRRRHADEFKQQVIDACLQPGVSMAAVALANGLNANLVRRWVTDHKDGAVAIAVPARKAPAPQTTLIPVTVGQPEITPNGEIRIEIHHEETVVRVSWPVAQASVCAQWLREVLR